MLRPCTLRLCVLLLALFAAGAALASDLTRARSGIEYASGNIRSMQADDFANPGMLWVTRGEKLWNTPDGSSGKSCAGCHRDAASSMKGVATHYPLKDRGTGRLLNLEARINQCRETRQGAEPYRYETDELLGLTAYVAHQSRGMPLQVRVNDDNRMHYERGKAIYYRRQGQMNLACTHCHERNAGRRLLSETISEGHGNAYPIYRLEWQSAGSLQRRLRSCYFGVRAGLPEFGSEELLDLEFFLAQRAAGLKVETPGVRR